MAQDDINDQEQLTQITEASQNIARIEREHFYSRLKLILELSRTRIFRFGGILLLTGTSICFAAAAYFLEANSFWQNMSVNLSTGILLFLAVPIALRLVGENTRRFLVLGALLSLILAVMGFHTDGVTQALLANASIGTMLVAALDYYLSGVLTALEKEEQDTLVRLMESEQAYTHGIEALTRKIENTNNALDYKYAMEDFLKLPRPYQFGGISIDPGDDDSE